MHLTNIWVTFAPYNITQEQRREIGCQMRPHGQPQEGTSPEINWLPAATHLLQR
jgi:hypothetical protein